MELTPAHYKRLKRRETAGDARALNFTCFHNQPFLKSDRACRWLADSVENAIANHECDLWAYCFMPTHAHLLVYPRAEQPDIAAFLESLKKSVTKKSLTWVRIHAPAFLRRMTDRQPNGKISYRFWQRGGGYDRNLWSRKATWDMIDYIHQNPVVEGLCVHSSHWYWSSAGSYHNGVDGPLPLTLRHRPGRP